MTEFSLLTGLLQSGALNDWIPCFVSQQAITNLRENMFGEEIQNVMRETIDEQDENITQVKFTLLTHCFFSTFPNENYSQHFKHS